MLLTMKHGQTTAVTKPTLAFNIDSLAFQNLEFQVWDAPGQQPFRQIWLKGYDKAKILVFVLDTANEKRYAEAQAEFLKVINEPMTRGIPLIFCFHKMDLPHAKQHIDEAKIFFNADMFKSRGCKNVKFLETSIADPSSLDTIKKELVKHIGEACVD